uniref:Polyprenal reductase n=1 Tax=Timema californicum TaxID=61474 RepID=A0A7R9J6T2_TIMCA|nr:unnamed protein product [Timema californicum]
MDLNFLKLIYFLTEINLLKICFSLMTLFMIVGGGLMNSIEHCLPIFFKQTFRFGKFAYQGEPSQLAPIEVPKRWFRHFYVFAAAYTSVITLVTFQLYFVSGTFTLSPAFSFVLDLLASDDRTVKVSAVSCFLSLCLLTIHSWHRLYETWFISVFSDSRINILHYAVGYAHYIGAVAAILAESPGFTDTKDDIRDWITNNEVDEITDNDIVEMVTQEEVIKEEEDGRKNIIPHSEGFKTIEAALQYISQQEEATPADSSACDTS